MASYAARHKAPPKHRVRGRSMFAESPTPSGAASTRRQSQARQDQGGSRRALVEPPGGNEQFAARPDETWRLSAPTVKRRSAEPRPHGSAGEVSRVDGSRTDGWRTDGLRAERSR
ncbi:MAG: hypothetical protein ACRDP8_09435, partial [Actinopolymorphaceae bacterium]